LSKWLCGAPGQNMECPGFAIGQCQGGEADDCSGHDICPDQTWAAVQCSGDTDIGKGAPFWKYGHYGDHLTCGTTAVTGLCGSGTKSDCSGGSWFGIDCAANGVQVIPETCVWSYHGIHTDPGVYFTCPDDRPILTGACGSGSDTNCNGYFYASYCCAENATVKQVTGRWIAGPFSSGSQSVQLSFGTSSSHTTATTKQVGWAISETIKGGMTVGPSVAKESSSIAISASLSRSISSTDTKMFSQTMTTTYKTDLGAGLVWQWVYDSKFTHGSATTWGNALVATEGYYAPPCCLPGWFVNSKDPTGSCRKGTPDLCERHSSRRRHVSTVIV